MPLPTHDSGQADEHTHTPPYNDSFGPNTDKLHYLLKFTTIAVTKYTEQLRTQVKEVSPKIASLTPPIAEAIIKPLEAVAEGHERACGWCTRGE